MNAAGSSLAKAALKINDASTVYKLFVEYLHSVEKKAEMLIDRKTRKRDC